MMMRVCVRTGCFHTEDAHAPACTANGGRCGCEAFAADRYTLVAGQDAEGRLEPAGVDFDVDTLEALLGMLKGVVDHAKKFEPLLAEDEAFGFFEMGLNALNQAETFIKMARLKQSRELARAQMGRR